MHEYNDWLLDESAALQVKADLDSGILKLQSESKTEEMVQSAVEVVESEVKLFRQEGSTAVIKIHGTINLYLYNFPYYVSLSYITKSFEQALADPTVKNILLDIHSPGGQAVGVLQCAKLIFDAREKKPIITYVTGNMASGAYWIGSAASMIFADPLANIGSIGAVVTFIDDSRYFDKLGIKFISIVSKQSPKKMEDPTKGEGLKATQERIDTIAQIFINEVAKHRGITPQTVLENYGQGGVFNAFKALEQGLCDQIVNLSDLLTALKSGGNLTQIESTTIQLQPLLENSMSDRKNNIVENTKDTQAGDTQGQKIPAVAESASAEDESTGFEVQVADLRKQVIDVSKDHATLNEKLKSLEKANEELKANVSQLEEQRKEQKTALDKAQANIKDLNGGKSAGITGSSSKSENEEELSVI